MRMRTNFRTPAVVPHFEPVPTAIYMYMYMYMYYRALVLRLCVILLPIKGDPFTLKPKCVCQKLRLRLGRISTQSEIHDNSKVSEKLTVSRPNPYSYIILCICELPPLYVRLPLEVT